MSADVKVPLILRRLTPADAGEYRRLLLSGMRESPTSYGRSYAQVRREPRSFFSQRLAISPAAWTYGAYRGRALVAMLQLVRDIGYKDRHKASIFGLYVAPRERGAGAARRLMEMAVAQARRMKVRQVRLGFEGSNVAAQGLYERMGFVEYGREKDSLRVAGKYYDEVLMVRKL